MYRFSMNERIFSSYLICNILFPNLQKLSSFVVEFIAPIHKKIDSQTASTCCPPVVPTALNTSSECIHASQTYSVVFHSVRWNKTPSKDVLGHYDILYDEELAQSDLLQQEALKTKMAPGALPSKFGSRIDRKPPIPTWK